MKPYKNSLKKKLEKMRFGGVKKLKYSKNGKKKKLANRKKIIEVINNDKNNSKNFRSKIERIRR